jgi:hypothetical protein
VTIGLAFLATASTLSQTCEPGTVLWEFEDIPVTTRLALGHDGIVYGANSDGPFAISADTTQASLLWQAPYCGPVNGQPTWVSVDSAGSLVIGMGNRVCKHDPSNGDVDWESDAPGTESFSGVALGSDDAVYAYRQGGLQAWDADGTPRWFSPFSPAGAPGTIHSSPIIDGGTIYARVNGVDGEYYLYAINSDGTQKWRELIEVPRGASYDLAIGRDSNVYVPEYIVGRGVRQCTPDGEWDSVPGPFQQNPLITIDRAGLIHTAYNDHSAREHGFAQFDPDTGLVRKIPGFHYHNAYGGSVIGNSGTVYALYSWRNGPWVPFNHGVAAIDFASFTHPVDWKYETSEGLSYQSVPLIGDHALYLRSLSSRNTYDAVTAICIESSGPAPFGWPMTHHDPQRTGRMAHAISGTVYDDASGDCVLETGEVGIPGVVIVLESLDASPSVRQATLTGSGAEVPTAVSRGDGGYDFDPPTSGRYEVSLSDFSCCWRQSCPENGGTHVVELASTPLTGLDFAVERTVPACQDLAVTVDSENFARQGTETDYTVEWGNWGTAAVGATVALHLDSRLEFVSSDDGVFDGDRTVTWTPGVLDPLVSGRGEVRVRTPMARGVLLASVATVEVASGTDACPASDMMLTFQEVTECDPDRTPCGFVLNCTDNSGNDCAESPPSGPLAISGDFTNQDSSLTESESSAVEDVIVRLTLDPALDISTLRLGASSHPYRFRIVGRELVWTFKDIDLRTSEEDQPKSAGYYSFQIEPHGGLDAGTIISINADIYFDSDPPTSTNTVEMEIQASSAPIAVCPDDITSECDGASAAVATLDGSESYDPDGDPLSYLWTSATCAFDDAAAAVTQATCPLGANTTRLVVDDGQSESEPCEVQVAVEDTMPPGGAITAPPDGLCTRHLVDVEDNFTDVCEEDLTREYEPGPGPTYDEHGDHGVTLTVTDSSGNAGAVSVAFTIDTLPPVVQIHQPTDGTELPESLPFTLVFTASDEDGATGGVLHEVVYLSGCPIYDGVTYGNGDGLLSDETLMLDQAELCRISEMCGFAVLESPEFLVEATDCAGNVGSDSIMRPGTVRLMPGICGQ